MKTIQLTQQEFDDLPLLQNLFSKEEGEHLSALSPESVAEIGTLARTKEGTVLELAHADGKIIWVYRLHKIIEEPLLNVTVGDWTLRELSGCGPTYELRHKDDSPYFNVRYMPPDGYAVAFAREVQRLRDQLAKQPRLTAIFEKVEKLAQSSLSPWISVQERLPEEPLVVVTVEKIHGQSNYRLACCFKGQFEGDAAGEDFSGVTHWMSMPPAP